VVDDRSSRGIWLALARHNINLKDTRER
jgi:hypothetical protein